MRLYFLGAWRRIVVDDMIPVDENKLPLLLRTANGHELWPMLLSKALLKLCSLTWTDNQEIVDFHPVACLTGKVSIIRNRKYETSYCLITGLKIYLQFLYALFIPVLLYLGWVCMRLDIGYLSPQDKWDFLRKYADHFEWGEDVTEQESQG